MPLMFLNGEGMQGGQAHPHIAGSRFVGPRSTAARYRFFAFGREFPGLLPDDEAGASIVGELYDVPMAKLAELLSREPAALELSVVTLDDGELAFGMVIRAGQEMSPGTIDITGLASWRRYLEAAAIAESSHALPMSSFPDASAEDVIDQPARVQFEVFLDEHRAALNGCLDGLTEEQARRSLVQSQTTLLGLVKHATFVEKVWFDEAITCRSRAEIGIPATPDESFILGDDDTIATVQQAHRDVCDAARRATAPLALDDLVHGNRRGPIPLRWVYLHMLRELAQHCGHADILREQLLSDQIAT